MAGLNLDPNILNNLLQQAQSGGEFLGEGAEATAKRVGDWVVKTLKPDFHVGPGGPNDWYGVHNPAPIEHTTQQAAKAAQLRFVPPTQVVPPGEQSTLTRIIQPYIKPAERTIAGAKAPIQGALNFDRRAKIADAMAKIASKKGITLRDLGHNIMVGRLPGSKALRALLADIGSIAPAWMEMPLPQSFVDQLLQQMQGPQG